MMGYLGVTIFLFFALVFAFNVGYYSIPEMQGIYNKTQIYYGNVTGSSGSTSYTEGLNQFIVPSIIGVSAVAVTALIYSSSAYLVVAAGAIAFLASYLLIPLSIFNSLGLPYPLNWFITGFMNLLLLITIFSFIKGND